jgi:hypothetical protein
MDSPHVQRRIGARSRSRASSRSGGSDRDALHEEAAEEVLVTAPTPLTVPEARAILRIDQILEDSFKARENEGQLLNSLEEMDAWIRLVESARDRVAIYEGMKRA